MRADPGIRHFLRSVDRRHRLAAALTATIAHAAVASCTIWIVDEIAPGSIVPFVAVVVAVAWLVTFATVHYRRGGASIAVLDTELGLRDGLRTWAAGVDDGPMADWLEQNLDHSLAALPPAARQRTVRERLRPLRYLVPILLALWILRWLQPDLAIPGLRGGGGGTAAGSATGGLASSGGAATDAGGGENAPEPPDRPPDPATGGPPEDPPPDPPEPEQGGRPEPKPLLDRPIRDDFVVPQFIGSGPSSRREAHVANIGSGGDQPPPPNVGSGGTDPEPPSADPAEFERAAERALRSRHVAADERAIVRRYFELLLSRRRDR